VENDVAICKQDNIEIIPMTPYLKLCGFIFGGSFKSTVQAVDNMDTIMLSLLGTLTEREHKVICERFGLHGENPKTPEAVGEIFSITKERVRQIEAKAIRKLRHPSRSGHIRTGNMEINYSIGYNSSYYTDRINEILHEELKYMIERGDSKTVFLENILKRNGIILHKRTVVEDAGEIFLEELGLQVRSYNCLKRSGIENLQQLLEMSDDDFMKVRNLGRKSYEEIKDKLNYYEEGMDIDGHITIEFEQNNEKTVYKFIGEDNEKIVKAIYQIIFCNIKNGKNIFNSKYSPGLKELLLMKGYVYIKDIDHDADLLIEQLRMADFECFAKEIEETKKYSTCCNNESEPIYVMFLEENEQSDFIRKNQGKTILELQELAKEMENTERTNCIDIIALYLA
jgi:hypothetical protein